MMGHVFLDQGPVCVDVAVELASLFWVSQLVEDIRTAVFSPLVRDLPMEKEEDAGHREWTALVKSNTKFRTI